MSCEAKGLGRGHVKRIKDRGREEREHMYLEKSGKNRPTLMEKQVTVKSQEVDKSA